MTADALLVGAPLTLGGHALTALSGRALWWPAQRTLLVADVHLGKAAALRDLGQAVPAGTGAETLQLLGQLVDALGAARLVVLGDLVHARRGCTPALDTLVQDWRAQRPGLAWQLVGGNHDRSAGLDSARSAAWGLELLGETLVLEGLCLQHAPPEGPVAGGLPVVAGHVHPAVRLRGPAGLRARLPCFWLQQASRVLVLPAFGTLTGHFEVQPAPADTVVAVGPGVAQAMGGTSPMWKPNWPRARSSK